MARYNRNRQTRKAIRAGRRTRRRPKRATRQRNQNSRAIAQLVKQVYVPRQFKLLQNAELTGATNIYPLVHPTEYTPCFQNYGSQAGTGVGTIYHMTGIKTKWMIQPEDTTVGTVDVFLQCFIVGVKPFQARKFREANLTLTENYHYTHAHLDTAGGTIDGNGFVMLNREIFDVKYNSGVRHIGNETLTGNNSTTIQDESTWGSTYTRHKRTIKSDNTSQVFTQLTNEDVRDSAQLYFIIFSNASLTAPLFFTANHIIYGSSTRGI
jgi:hypothetical protein